MVLVPPLCHKNNHEYILTTNDGEFMQITSFSKQEVGMLVWKKKNIHSPTAGMNFFIPYSEIKDIKNINGEIVWDNEQRKLAQVPKIGKLIKTLEDFNLNPGSNVKPSINLNPGSNVKPSINLNPDSDIKSSINLNPNQG